ncbi:thioredoxin domain-containing protein [Vibrio cholerae]|nr:thioredoxin domain-containing protein [Vibrio cholerae]
MVAAVLVVIVVIAVVVVNGARSRVPDAGPAPQGGNAEGGITLVSGTELAPALVQDVDSSTLPSDPAPKGSVPEGVSADEDGPLQVVAYVDVNCVHCADFEARHSEQIRSWLDGGDITFEYRTVAYLDRNSSTDYSSRGANAAACVADTAPEAYLDFTRRIFAHYEEGELDDDGLTALAAEVGAGDVSSCVDEGTFRPWVDYTTAAAQAAPVGGTPTVYVHGEEVPNGVADFGTLVQAHLDARS